MKVFILTNHYPYGTGEVFLTEELESIESEEQIIICPLEEKSEENNRKMNLPPNISVIKAGEMQLNIWDGMLWFRDIICSSSILFREIKSLVLNNNFHFTTAKRASAAWVIANIKKRKIAKILGHHRINQERIVLYSYWAVTSALGAVLLKDDTILKLTRVHGIDLYEERHSYQYLPFRRKIYNSLDLVLPISDAGKKYIQENYMNKSRWEKCMTSRLGTKDYGMNPAACHTQEMVIVSCSSVIAVKRVALILQTLLQIQDLEIRWIHFGDGALLEEIRAGAAECKRENLHFTFMGRRNKEEIMNYYRENHIDLFINVSASEGIPVSIMEALSFGIPVAATDVGAVKEIVKENINGWLLHKNEVVKELTERLYMFSSMGTGKRETLRKASREFWKQEYAAGKNYNDFYERIKIHLKDEI